MDFGIFSLMGYRDKDKPAATVLQEVIEQTRLADELGFGASWFAEHHFSNYAICPSPLMMVSACAPVTKRIKLATGVVILPLYNPARLLSEIAFADALSSGRLVLGVGSGYQPYEFDRLNVDLSASKPMLTEFMEVIRRGLTQDFFSFEGKYYSIPETHIAPRTVQAPLPIWLAGDSPQLHQIAAENGWGAIIAGRTGGLETLGAQRDRCAAVFAAAGVPEHAMPLAVQRHLCVSHDPRVHDEFAENALYQIRLTTALRRRSEAMDGTMLRNDPFPEEPSLDDIKANLMIGDAESVAKKLVRELRRINPSHICFYIQLGSFPHRQALQTMENFARDVIPLVERELGPLGQIGAPLPVAA